MPLYLKLVFCKHYIVWSCSLIRFDNICLLIGLSQLPNFHLSVSILLISIMHCIPLRSQVAKGFQSSAQLLGHLAIFHEFGR